MTKVEYKKIVGEYRALCALGYSQVGRPTQRAIYARIAEIEERIQRPAINRSYVHGSLTVWDVLADGQADSLVLGGRNRMKNHPTPNLKGV